MLLVAQSGLAISCNCYTSVVVVLPKMGRCPSPKTEHGAPESIFGLLRVDSDIPDRFPPAIVFFALWIGSAFGIGAVPDLDVEVIDIRTRLAVVLRLRPTSCCQRFLAPPERPQARRD